MRLETEVGKETPRGKVEQAKLDIPTLREVKEGASTGMKVTAAAKKIGVMEQTYYCWKKKYSDPRMAQTHQSVKEASAVY